MSSRRPTGRKPGRPLSGVEPLAERLTVMVPASMIKQLEARAGDRVPAFVRAAIARALKPTGRPSAGGRGRRVNRYRGR